MMAIKETDNRQTRKIRVLNVLGTTNIGGAEKLVLCLLNQHDKEEFEWAVCSLAKAGPVNLQSEFKKHNIRFYSLDLEGWSFRKNPFGALLGIFKLICKFKQTCKEYKPDVIHAHLFWPSVLSQILFGFSDIKVVNTYHNTVFSERSKKIFLKIVTFIFRPVCIACSEAVKKVILSERLAPKKCCTVVATGVNIDEYFHKTGLPVNSAFDEKPDHLKILQIGRLWHSKGYEYTIEALKILKEKCIQTYVCSVGAGPNKVELEKLAIKNGVSGNIKFLGGVDDDVKKKLLQTADIYIMPSLWEGLSQAMLEAMSMELPVVITDVGGASEVIENGKDGFLIPPRDASTLADKIMLLANDGGLRKRLGAAARKKVIDKYSLKQQAMRLENIYRNALENKKVDWQ